MIPISRVYTVSVEGGGLETTDPQIQMGLIWQHLHGPFINLPLAKFLSQLWQRISLEDVAKDVASSKARNLISLCCNFLAFSHGPQRDEVLRKETTVLYIRWRFQRGKQKLLTN